MAYVSCFIVLASLPSGIFLHRVRIQSYIMVLFGGYKINKYKHLPDSDYISLLKIFQTKPDKMQKLCIFSKEKDQLVSI